MPPALLRFILFTCYKHFLSTHRSNRLKWWESGDKYRSLRHITKKNCMHWNTLVNHYSGNMCSSSYTLIHSCYWMACISLSFTRVSWSVLWKAKHPMSLNTFSPSSTQLSVLPKRRWSSPDIVFPNEPSLPLSHHFFFIQRW